MPDTTLFATQWAGLVASGAAAVGSLHLYEERFR
jgi:hypothetical protein